MTSVVCIYCGKIVEVDKSLAGKLDETTAYCCRSCMLVNYKWDKGHIV